MNRDESLLERIQTFFDNSPDDKFCCAYLFGSAARGEMRPDSDVDIAVLYRTMPPATLEGSGVGLAGALEDHLHKQVDLIVLNRASPDLVHRILRDGLLIFDRHPELRVRFEVQARNEYFDIKPYLDEYRLARTGKRDSEPGVTDG